MKALTIWQPWASLIISGWKPYEFRGWAAPASIVGQRIAIHAAERPIKAGEMRDIMDYVCSPAGQFDEIDPVCMDLLERAWRREIELPMSAILGTAILGQPCVTSAPQSVARWAWPMLQIEAFAAPISAKGAQGFWEWRS